MERVKVEAIGGSAEPPSYAVTASVRNTRSIATRARQAANRKLGLPDLFEVSGPGLTVAGGGILVDRDTGELVLVEDRPERIPVESGIRGGEVVRVRSFVRGKGDLTVKFTAQKGGGLTRTARLPEAGCDRPDTASGDPVAGRCTIGTSHSGQTRLIPRQAARRSTRPPGRIPVPGPSTPPRRRDSPSRAPPRKALRKRWLAAVWGSTFLLAIWNPPHRPQR